MNILMQQNIHSLPNDNLYSIPVGVEYEKLERVLRDRENKKYHVIDRRTSFVPSLTPGVSNKINNQSAINFEEPNTKSAYPQSTIPYSQGLIWE